MLKNQLSSLNTLPTSQEIAEKAEQILQKIKKIRWTNEQIQKDLGRRTIKIIQESGETCYMGACVDNSLLLAQELKKLIPAEKLVVGCELFQRKTTGNLGFHLFLEDRSVSPVRIIDFVRKNEVAIYEGSYKNELEGKQLQQLQTFSCQANEISEEDSFLSLAKKMGIQLPPELFQAYLSKLQQDNTAENFQNFQKNSPITVKISAQGKKALQTDAELLENFLKTEED